MKIEKVAIVGAGTIGRGWIPLFARAGLRVSVHDTCSDNRDAALAAAKQTLHDLAGFGLVDDPEAVFRLIEPVSSLEAVLDGAQYAQESAPEQVPVQRDILARIDAIADPHAIVSTSCSSLDPIEIFERVGRPERCIVVHPFNPPHLLPLLELLPGPGTSAQTLAATYDFMRLLGQSPVILRKFVPGYVVNRLQAAVVNEAMNLVGQGVISPTDLDMCMTESLGRRWAFIGPFETMDLNADTGIEGYAERYGKSYVELGADMVSDRPWSKEAVSAVVAARRDLVPLEGLGDRRTWRDRQLMQMLVSPLRTHEQSAVVAEYQV
jgi:3-hydroxyacyl-CoA dehydrogenase